MSLQKVLKTKVKTNYFTFKCDQPIFKYKVDTEPSIPSNQVGLFFRILSKLREGLSNLMSPYQPASFSLYSPVHVEETTLNAEYDNLSYTVKIIPSGMLEVSGDDRESIVFMGRFFKVLQSQLRLKQIGRKYFDDKAVRPYDNWKLKVWPGYQTSLNAYQDRILVNIDTCFKVLRETTMHEFIENLMQRFQGNQERVKEEIIGMTVMTK